MSTIVRLFLKKTDEISSYSRSTYINSSKPYNIIYSLCLITSKYSHNPIVFSVLRTFRLVAGNALNCLFGFGVTNFTGGAVKSCKQEGFVIDEQGKLKRFNRKKLWRKRCGSLRGRGWKYLSGCVEGIFPVLSPIAQKILSFIQKETDPEKVADVVGTLPCTHASWHDLINVTVQIRFNKKWDSIILVCEWILRRSSFQPDVICFNFLIDAYGPKFLHKEA